MTKVVVVDPLHPAANALKDAADILIAGGLVAFPTETVYGLGADATNAAAVERIFEAKGRPATNPTIVHVSDLSAAKACAAHWPSIADDLATAFWPGPLTIIVPAAPRIDPTALAGGSTVGLRVPSHPVALALLRAVGRPIAAPSANRSESLSPTTAQHVLRTLDGRIDRVLDGGPTTGGLESTVVDLSVSPPQLLRPGLISAEQLRRILPALEVCVQDADAAPLRSPGRLKRHYAPTTPLELVADVEMRIVELARLTIGVITFEGDELATTNRGGCTRILLPAEPTKAASLLYRVLHELDLAGLDRILVVEPPAGDDWSAVRDRLKRASTSPRFGTAYADHDASRAAAVAARLELGVQKMADNLKDRTPEDAKRISLSEDWEIKYWTKALGVSETELKELVKKHGPMADDVRKHAKK